MPESTEAIDGNGSKCRFGESATGLQLLLDGAVSSESERFRVLSTAGDIVDPDRLIDSIEIVRPDPPQVTKFSLEILRNRGGISLIILYFQIVISHCRYSSPAD